MFCSNFAYTRKTNINHTFRIECISSSYTNILKLKRFKPSVPHRTTEATDYEWKPSHTEYHAVTRIQLHLHCTLSREIARKHINGTDIRHELCDTPSSNHELQGIPRVQSTRQSRHGGLDIEKTLPVHRFTYS